MVCGSDAMVTAKQKFVGYTSENVKSCFMDESFH